jgi:predicted metal-dependent TIM-barrel fold hydrolase
MDYIDPHIHMISRTTDDYRKSKAALDPGCAFPFARIQGTIKP